MILETSVAIVGSGMGGATTAYGLAQAGIDCLVIERGDFVKKEDANWSAREIFINQRYKPNEKWLDAKGKSFTPGVHYIVGGNTKVYGSSLPRFREQDFLEIRHKEESHLLGHFLIRILSLITARLSSYIKFMGQLVRTQLNRHVVNHFHIQL